MNAKVIIYLLGRISTGLAIAQLLPLLMSVVYGEYATSRTFIFSIAVAVILAGIFDYYGDGRGARNLSVREGIGTVFFSWLLAAALGALPYCFDGILNPAAAYFESMSGLTTTGATAIANLDIVSRSLLLWRTLTHWIGGIGIIVLFVALLPQIAGGAVTRTILCPLISHLGDNPPQFQALTDTQRNELENTLDKLFGLCYEEDGKFHPEIEEDMSWLYKTVVKWCNDCRQQVVKTMSKSMDVFYKRSSVSAFRIAALMQVLYKVEGKKSEKEIRKLVRQTYLACADRILQNMLQRWGKAFEQISAEGEGEPYHTVDYFSELPQEFSYQFLEEFLKQKELKTPARNMVCNWRRWGWLEKPAKGEDRKVLRKTQQKGTIGDGNIKKDN